MNQGKEKSKDKVIKELKSEIRRLQGLVVRDELTGALNRRGITNQVNSLLKEINYLRTHPDERTSCRVDNLSLVFLDIDNFKEINDKYGHVGGDVVLKWLSFEIQNKIRRMDFLGRFGGDEFVIVFVGANEDIAYHRAEAVRRHIVSHKVSNKMKDLKVTASIGVVAAKSIKAKTMKDLVSAADRAMYEAKNKYRKNCVIRYGDLKRRLKKKTSKK